MIQNEEIWKKIYEAGQQLNKYPWNDVITFVYNNYSDNIKRENFKILEVGCGSGNNLWFAAREGFNVTGLDISEIAIEYARNRFKSEGLNGNFIVGGFEEMPFEDETFDLVIDRAALTYLNLSEAKNALVEIKRVLKVNGKMFFNPFSDRHSSSVSGRYTEDGITTDISSGIKNCGDTCFYGRRDIYELFKSSWKLESIKHSEVIEQLMPEYFVYAEWRVIAKKLDFSIR